MYSLIEMLKYMRPEGSKYNQKFCNRFLKPVFGDPDAHGNYLLRVGDNPDIAFMAHHDTVHRTSGKQTVWVEDDHVFSDADCLGADCTTGVYIILCMIEAQVPGVYVVHAAEEVGCIGSSAIVRDDPLWLQTVNYAISFDRFGTKSIITHQMGERTCSDTFAKSLSSILDLGHEADTRGSFTDSYEYRGVIPECTNLSVGYYNQHTTKETQDLVYLENLIDSLINADWSKLTVDRTPQMEYDDSWMIRGSDPEVENGDEMYELVKDHPQMICDLLESYGITYEDLLDELYFDSGRKFG